MPNLLKIAFASVFVSSCFAQVTQPGASTTKAVTLTCGQTIVADTTLAADVSCPADAAFGIVIGASNITLDLGGHVLSGYAPVGTVSRGVLAANVGGITIKNGAVEEFDEGVTLLGTGSVTIENLSVSNLQITEPAHGVIGINISNSSPVVVRDSQFQFAPQQFHHGAIGVGASYVTVSNIEVNGGGTAVEFGFATTCDPANSSNGEIVNSRFVEPFESGVLVACSSGVRIAGNEFDLTQSPGKGVESYGPFSGAVTGLRTEGNTISGGYMGIDYQGTLQSTATNNTVSGSTFAGVGVRQSLGEDGSPISYPAGNVVSGNITWGNAIDLYDDETGVADTWTGNVCATKQGAGIPACAALAVVADPSDQSAVSGTTASFAAAATYAGYWQQNPPLAAVQWQVSGDGGSAWTNVAGATSATYRVTAALADSGKQFRAVFTNSAGTATTKAATLTVSAASSAPAVTAQPASLTVAAGQTAALTAAASGAPTPAAQWQVSTDGGTTWADLVTLAAAPSYSFLAAATDNGKQYRAVFTNSFGTATTNAAALTISTAPSAPVVTAQPANQTVRPGRTAAFSAVASGTPAPTAQWQVSADGGSTWADVRGATLPWYGFTAAAADSGRQYRAVFTNSAGTATTNAATLTVSASANPVVCGQTITADTKLTADLSCPANAGYALTIGAAVFAPYLGVSNITLDLGGHVLSGSVQAGTQSVGVLAESANRITIRNGTIQGFNVGVSVWNASGVTIENATIEGAITGVLIFGSGGVTVENLSVANLESTDPTQAIVGIAAFQSTGVVVRDSQFAFAPMVFGKDAVDVSGSDVSVSNIQVTGGGTGVDFAIPGTCDPVLSRSNGEVLNSRFLGSRMAGVLVQCTSSARIAGNDFALPQGLGEGIVASPPLAGAVTGLRVEGNAISGGYMGINYSGIAQSTTANNTVTGATGWGLSLTESPGLPGGTSFPPTGNVISGNLAWGNAVDLYDDGAGQANRWTGNVCATGQGAGIAACPAVAIVTNPSDQSVVAGTAASFSSAATYSGWLAPGVTSSPPMAAVQWQVSTNGGLAWTNVSGATSSTYSFTPTIADSGKQFRAMFTNNKATATTTAATLTAGAASSPPAVTAQPSNQTVSDGQTATFSAAASGTPTPTVLWQVSTDGGTTWVSLVTGATSPTYSFTCAAAASGNRYRAVFTSSLGTATTNAATLTVPGIGAVVSGASFQPGIAAGGWITILGNGLASKTDTWANAIIGDNLPTSLDGTTVSVGASPAYISYISPTQINALAPNVAPGTVPVTVTDSAGVSLATAATVQAVQPAFFQWGNYAVATRPDYTLAVKNGTFPGLTTVPAKRGEVIILWGTGFGPTSPAAPAGVDVPSGTTYYTANPVSVTVGGASATVYGAALSPGYAGLYQVAILIPTSIPDGDCAVIATVAGVQSPVGILITVQN